MHAPLTVTSVASTLHDPDRIARLRDDLAPALHRAGARIAAEPDDGPLALLLLTGGTEAQVLERCARRPAGPVLLLAHGGHNSLPASLEALARLQADGRRARIAYLPGPGEGDDGAVTERLADLAAHEALHRARLGLIGGPSSWLVASSPEPATVMAAWGPTVVPLDLSALTSRLAGAAIDLDRIDGLRDRGAALARTDLEAASRVHAALDALVRAERLDALTLRCFDLLGPERTTGCLALALLNDRGLVAGCEGDLPSALAMLLCRVRLGAAAWMANPARVNPGAGELVLAHCTIAPSLVTGYRLDTHFESGLGVALAADLAPGPVTLLRVGGVRLERFWTVEADLVASLHEADLCRTQARVRLSPDAISALLEAPLGNHLVLVRGHHAARLRGYHSWLVG
jgi:L-fucose isomerase-like protein